jgi:hypothetical protein
MVLSFREQSADLTSPTASFHARLTLSLGLPAGAFLLIGAGASRVHLSSSSIPYVEIMSLKATGEPATTGEIASVEFQGLKDFFFTMPRDERLQNTNALIDQIRPVAFLAVELLAFDRAELIAKVSSDFDRWGPFLPALADAADGLKALQDIVGAAEARMAVALANITGGHDHEATA